MEQKIVQLITIRKGMKYKIPLGDMPESERYNKLYQESKYLMNIIKMICYRAEDEIRALVKAITHLSIDIEPDKENSILNITLYPLANLRSQNALAEIIEQINATNTVYPGTMLIMKFKITTITTLSSQDV